VISELVAGETPSTKSALAALAAATDSLKVLVVLARHEELAWLSLRNVATVHVLAVDQLNAYDVLVNDDVVFTSAALDAFVSGPVSGKSAKAVARESETADPSGSEADAEPTNAQLAQEETK
jgi:large subunit ribosomal protein L4